MELDITRRVMGASAVCSTEGKVIGVDVSGLIRRLLLFDKYVLASVRLGEFPLLARKLGYEGLRDLLAAKLIEIRCECVQLAQMGHAELFGDQRLPVFTYRFNWLDAHDKAKYVHDCLHGLHGASGLQNKQVIKLKGAIAGAIRPLPAELRSELFPPFQHELLHNEKLVTAAIQMELRRRLIVSPPFRLVVHQAISSQRASVSGDSASEPRCYATTVIWDQRIFAIGQPGADCCYWTTSRRRLLKLRKNRKTAANGRDDVVVSWSRAGLGGTAEAVP
jgi:hypothetical protein